VQLVPRVLREIKAWQVCKASEEQLAQQVQLVQLVQMETFMYPSPHRKTLMRATVGLTLQMEIFTYTLTVFG
jgi:hypothetical protein